MSAKIRIYTIMKKIIKIKIEQKTLNFILTIYEVITT